MFRSTKAWRPWHWGAGRCEWFTIWAVRGVQLTSAVSIKMENRGGHDWSVVRMQCHFQTREAKADLPPVAGC